LENKLKFLIYLAYQPLVGEPPAPEKENKVKLRIKKNISLKGCDLK